MVAIRHALMLLQDLNPTCRLNARNLALTVGAATRGRALQLAESAATCYLIWVQRAMLLPCGSLCGFLRSICFDHYVATLQLSS